MAVVQPGLPGEVVVQPDVGAFLVTVKGVIDRCVVVIGSRKLFGEETGSVDTVDIHRYRGFKAQHGFVGIQNVVLQPESWENTVTFGIVAGQIHQTHRVDHVALIGMQIGRGPVYVKINIGVITILVPGVYRDVGHFAQGFVQYIVVVISVVVRISIGQFCPEYQPVR